MEVGFSHQIGLAGQDKRQENRDITKRGGGTGNGDSSGENYPISGDYINSEIFPEIRQKQRFGHFLSSGATVSVLNSGCFHCFEHTK